MAKKLEFSATIDGSGFRAGIVEMERLAGSAAGRMEKAMTGSLGGGGSVEEIARNRNAMTAASAREREKIQQEMAQADAALNAKMTSDWKKNTAAMRQGGLDPQSFNTVTGAANQMSVGLRRAAGSYAQLLHSARATFDSIASGMPLDRVIAQQAPQVVQALIQMKLGWIALGAAALGVWHITTKYIAESLAGHWRQKQIFDQLTAAANVFREALKRMHVEESAGLKADAQRIQINNDLAELKQQVADAELEQQKIQLQNRSIDERKLDNLQYEFELKKKIAALELADLEGKLRAAEGRRNRQEIGAEERQRFRAQIRELQNSAEANTPEGQARQAELEQAIADSFTLSYAKAQASIAELTTKIAAKKMEINEAELAAHDFYKKPAVRPVSPGLGADSLTSVGNFLGGSRSMIESLARRQVDLLARIELNTRRTVASGGGIQWPTP